MSWQTAERNYWPFETREQAFEYIDLEIMDPSCALSPMARHLPRSILREYIEEKRKKYLQRKQESSPLKLPASTLRRSFRGCHGPEAAQLLVDYSAEHWGATFPLGYLDINEKKSWFHIVLGTGMFGPRVWHRVQRGTVTIVGIAIGMIKDTSHIVLVLPNGPIFLVWDVESEMPLADDIPYTIVSVYPSIAYIGTQFQLNYGTDDDDFTVENWSDGSKKSME